MIDLIFLYFQYLFSFQFPYQQSFNNSVRIVKANNERVFRCNTLQKIIEPLIREFNVTHVFGHFAKCNFKYVRILIREVKYAQGPYGIKAARSNKYEVGG